MRCVDVAALFAAAILRRNPDSVVIPFDTSSLRCADRSKRFDPQHRRATGKYGGGGTNCALPLEAANVRTAIASLPVLFSSATTRAGLERAVTAQPV